MKEDRKLTVDVKLPFRYAAGATASRFFREFRDNKRIFGTKCPTCGEIQVPARSWCSSCHVKTEDWVELTGRGSLVGWTGVKGANTIFCMVRLDGADSLFVHKLSNYTDTKLEQGLSVEVVWQESRQGSILDIAYFQPLKS